MAGQLKYSFRVANGIVGRVKNNRSISRSLVCNIPSCCYSPCRWFSSHRTSDVSWKSHLFLSSFSICYTKNKISHISSINFSRVIDTSRSYSSKVEESQNLERSQIKPSTAEDFSPTKTPSSIPESSAPSSPSSPPLSSLSEARARKDEDKYAGDTFKDMVIGFESSPIEISPPAKHDDFILKMIADKKKKIDFTAAYTHNIFVPVSRAMNEFLLEPSELDHLQKYARRSPYGEREYIFVFKREDLEKRAIDKWGSLRNLKLQKNYQKARRDRYKEGYSSFTRGSEFKSVQKPFIYQPFNFYSTGEDPLERSDPMKVVLYAVTFNSLNCIMKLGAWLHTGSHSMFAEFIHSLADTANQIILAIGIRKSMREPDLTHPYGFAKLRNVTSLISGVGIFFLGAGLNIYHGIVGLLGSGETSSLYWAFAVLGTAFLTEGGTLLMALKRLKESSVKTKVSLYEYISRGTDPTTNVVLLEDAAAVLGTIIAGTCISIAHFTSFSIADPIGSLLIGSLLGGVASIIISTNTGTLVGRSIPAEQRQALVAELEDNRMIRTLIDVKATEVGGKAVKFKAEVDFDGKEVTKFYLENIDNEKLYSEIQDVKSPEDAEKFMLKHGENIVDTVGLVIDKIEKDLKAKHPDIKHVDLEQL